MMQTPRGDPTGNAFGLIFFGAGNATPKGLFQAIHIDSPGVFRNPVIPWKHGLLVADGAATVGMTLGKSRIAGDSESQPLEFRASTAGADQHQWDASYTYVCVETNRRRRSALQDS